MLKRFETRKLLTRKGGEIQLKPFLNKTFSLKFKFSRPTRLPFHAQIILRRRDTYHIKMWSSSSSWQSQPAIIQVHIGILKVGRMTWFLDGDTVVLFCWFNSFDFKVQNVRDGILMARWLSEYSNWQKSRPKIPKKPIAWSKSKKKTFTTLLIVKLGRSILVRHIIFYKGVGWCQVVSDLIGEKRKKRIQNLGWGSQCCKILMGLECVYKTSIHRNCQFRFLQKSPPSHQSYHIPHWLLLLLLIMTKKNFSIEIWGVQDAGLFPWKNCEMKRWLKKNVNCLVVDFALFCDISFFLLWFVKGLSAKTGRQPVVN